MSEATEARHPLGRRLNQRRLVAVAYADMVGYSRLIGLDDAGTLERLRTLLSDLIDPVTAEHGGGIVHTGGDSLILVFDSIDGAVRSAVKIQRQISTYDDRQLPDRAIRFRIGIDIGDAITDGSNFQGRLHAECRPGGICVTRVVYNHMRERLAFEFEELGALKLKNIAFPVEAFFLNPLELVGKRRRRAGLP